MPMNSSLDTSGQPDWPVIARRKFLKRDVNHQAGRMAMKDVSVVLAHGAWADGSSWARVITALESDAVKVFAAPLPLTSLADDVAAAAWTGRKGRS